MLKGFSGYLQTDGYSAYNDVESVTRVGCWSHARRKWVDCFEGKKPVEGSQSEKAFAYVEKIFALEACWRDMSPDERQKHRMAEMKPVMDAYLNFLSSFSSEKRFESAKGTNILATPEKTVGGCSAGWKTGTYEQCGGANR